MRGWEYVTFQYILWVYSSAFFLVRRFYYISTYSLWVYEGNNEYFREDDFGWFPEELSWHKYVWWYNKIFKERRIHKMARSSWGLEIGPYWRELGLPKPLPPSSLVLPDCNSFFGLMKVKLRKFRESPLKIYFGPRTPHGGPTQLTFTCSKWTIKTVEKRCEICSKLTIKTLERSQWRCSFVFNINFEDISHLILVLLLLTLSK